MEINNVFSPVPFYKNKKYWHSNKWYTYGQKCPIMMTSQNTLPFQLVVDSGVTLSSFAIKKADNDTVVRTVSTSGNYASIPGESYNVIQVKACTISALPYGNYYYALTLSDGSTYISDIIAIISDMSKCIKITYKNVENLYFSSGHIDFSNDFVFELYLPTTIGKPEYEYEEELTKRLGYKFLESQVVNKVYKFTFPATEQMCDAYRFVRMCDYIRIDTYNPDLSEYDHYNVIYLSSEVDWLDNGDIASIETSFETDSIVQKLQDYSRTQLVNFYNALLSNSDEVLKFDDETIAQYYSNYIQSIDGKMIRQLDAASSISDNTVIAIDENNGIGAAKKILLKPLITSVIGDELRASEVLQNFQAHINNGNIHITAQERSLLSLFALDENGDVYLKDKRGFYSNSFISAKGKSSGGSSGSASALYQLVDVEKNDTDDGVQGAEVGKVLMYNGTKWYASVINTGLDEQALKTYLDNNKYTTTTYVDSKVSEVSTELNNLLQGALNNKVDTAFFARVFGLLDANGNEIAVNDVTTVADSIKAKFGLWTEQYLSAKGKNDNTSGSASALYQLVDILSNDTNDGVYGAEAGKVLMYNGSKWYAGTVNTGLDEKALKTYLDANKYTTTSYVDSKVSAVSTKLDNFLEGSDTDGIINKWKELEAFLAGQTQTSTLAELLAVKADKSIKIIAGTGLTGGGDLSSNVTLSLASSGVTAGTYTKVTIDAYGRVTAGTTLSSSDIPNIAISQVNGLQAALNNKVDNAFFARVFGLLDANGNEIAINDISAVASSIKAKFGLWTEQYISALGKNPSSSGGGGGASALYQLVDILPNDTNDGVYGASTGKVLMYNGTKWQAGSVVTDISTLTLQVNGSNIATFNGKSAVTANLTVPTKLSQLTNDSGYLTSLPSHTHSYAGSSSAGGPALSLLTNGKNQGGDSCYDENPGLHFYKYNGDNNTIGGGDGFILQWSWAVGSYGQQLYLDDNPSGIIGIRGRNLDGTFTAWSKILTSSNWSSYCAPASHTHSYLPLSGGTITHKNYGDFELKRNNSNYDSVIRFSNLNDGILGYIGISGSATTSAPKIPYYSPNGTHVYPLLHSGNYNSYSPTLTGTGASGDWDINIKRGLYYGHLGPIATDEVLNNFIEANVFKVGLINGAPSLVAAFPNYTSGIVLSGGWDKANKYGFQLMIDDDPNYFMALRQRDGGNTWSTWKRIPMGDGTGASGTWGISITGNATYAPNATYLYASDSPYRYGDSSPYYAKIRYNVNSDNRWYLTMYPETPKVIAVDYSYKADNADKLDGYHYDSFAQIAVPNNLISYSNEFNFVPSAYAGSILINYRTVGGTNGAISDYKFCDGTGKALATISAGQFSGNSASATKLQTARTIWGQSFDGTANVGGDLMGAGGYIDMQYNDEINRYGGQLYLQHRGGAVTGQGTGGTVTGHLIMCDNGGTVAIGTSDIESTYKAIIKGNIKVVNGVVLGYMYKTNTNAAAFVWDKPGSNYTGVGSDNTADTIRFSACTVTGEWVSYTQNWKFYGNIYATGAVTAKASSSDIRLKTDITDYKALDIIRNHRSVKYHWNEVAKANTDIFNDDYWHYGLIAQDVQRDMPQMVSDVFKDYLVINYERLIPICWKGLQEVDDEVTKLKKKVRKLEMEIRELKQKEDRL